MGWVRLSDDFYDHAKFADAGPLALALWAAALAWCNRNLTDGFVPRARARTLLDFEGLAFVDGMSGSDVTADEVIGDLVAVTLWDEVDGGYRIHDYHDYQPTAAEVQAKRVDVSNKRREAGRKGGLMTQTKNRRSGEANEQTGKQESGKALSKSEAPTPTPIMSNGCTNTHAQHYGDPAAAAVGKGVDDPVISSAFELLVVRRMLSSKVPIVNPAGYRKVTLAALKAEHVETLAELDRSVTWTPQMLADWLEPVPKRPSVAAQDAEEPPVVVSQSFHPFGCVCGGQGTNRTCAGVIEEAQ